LKLLFMQQANRFLKALASILKAIGRKNDCWHLGSKNEASLPSVVTKDTFCSPWLLTIKKKPT